jgi:hypothetical protein
MRQYVACQFGGQGRPYTFHYDGDEQFAVGDTVKVETRDGYQLVKVCGFADSAPGFQTRAIVSREGTLL